MKITKKDVSCVEDPKKNPKETKETEETKDAVECAKAYAQARENILAAIDCLGPKARTDRKAKDSIANLSVVLLDLQ